MFCKNCGREQKKGQKFCPQCGTPFPELKEKFVAVNNNDGDMPSSNNQNLQKAKEPSSDVKNSVLEAKKMEQEPHKENNVTISPNYNAHNNNGNNPAEKLLTDEEIKKYEKWKSGLKWGGLVMAIILGAGSFSEFSWLGLLLYGALVYMVYNAFFGNNAGKTFADLNLIKFKSFACMGVCLLLVMCGTGSGSLGGGDPYKEAYNKGYDYGYYCSGYRTMRSGQIRVAFNSDYDTKGTDLEIANKLYTEYSRGAWDGFEEGKKVFNK